MVLEPTPTSAHVTDPSFIDHDRIFYTWDDGTHRVGYVTKADNHQVALASLATDLPPSMDWLKAYRDDVYWLNARPLDDPRTPMESIVQRAPIRASSGFKAIAWFAK